MESHEWSVEEKVAALRCLCEVHIFLENRCSELTEQYMVRNVSTLHGEHEDRGTDSEIALLRKEVQTLHEKFEQTEKDKNALITMVTTLVSGIERRFTNLDGEVQAMRQTLNTIVTDVRKVEEKVVTSNSTLNESLLIVDDRVESLMLREKLLAKEVINMNKGLVEGFQKVQEAIEAIEDKINIAPATKRRRAIRQSASPIPPLPRGPPITTATEWRQRCLAEVHCKTFADRCKMKCRFCEYDYRGKAVTVNAHVSHLKMKHDFVARRDISNTNDSEKYLPYLVEAGPEEKRRDEQRKRQTATVKSNLERDARALRRR